MIAAKLAGKALTETEAPRLAPVVNILDALQRSLDSMARKSVVSDRPAGTSKRKTSPGFGAREKLTTCARIELPLQETGFSKTRLNTDHHPRRQAR